MKVNSHPRHVASYLNRVGDIEVTVTLLDDGQYAVRVHDVDAEQTLPYSRRFKTIEPALAYALRCAASGNDENDTDDLPF